MGLVGQRSLFNIAGTSGGGSSGKSLVTTNSTKCSCTSSGTISTGTSGGTAVTIPPKILTILETIQKKYSSNMANRLYSSIPTDYQQYVDFVFALNSITINDTSIKLLFKIVTDALNGSVNISSIFQQYTEATFQVVTLNQQLNEVLSNKNMVKALTGATGTFSLTKTFILAPVYSYYIMMYGMPAFGVGFDPGRIAALATVLELHGIKPYGDSDTVSGGDGSGFEPVTI